MVSNPPENSDLGARIAAAQAEQAKREAKVKPGSNANSGYGLGMKIVLDLIGGALVGLIFGLALDHVLGTQPWGLLILLGLGMAAGFRLVLRTAQQQGKRTEVDSDAAILETDAAKKGQEDA
jgi:ATP synthase protein I